MKRLKLINRRGETWGHSSIDQFNVVSGSIGGGHLSAADPPGSAADPPGSGRIREQSAKNFFWRTSGGCPADLGGSAADWRTSPPKYRPPGLLADCCPPRTLVRREHVRRERVRRGLVRQKSWLTIFWRTCPPVRGAFT